MHAFAAGPDPKRIVSRMTDGRGTACSYVLLTAAMLFSLLFFEFFHPSQDFLKLILRYIGVFPFAFFSRFVKPLPEPLRQLNIFGYIAEI